MDNVESCRIKLQCAGDRDRLVIQLQCKYGTVRHYKDPGLGYANKISLSLYQGILKTHKLHFELCDPLAAIYSKASAPHHWTISSKLAHDWLVHFHARLEEITMRCAQGEMALKSFTETVLADEEDQMASRGLQTELTVDIEDFDAFTVVAPTEVTYGTYRPVVLTVTQTPDLYALDLVVATTASFEDDPAAEPSTGNSINNNNNNDRSEPQPQRLAAAAHPRTPAPAAPPPRSHARGVLDAAAAASSPPTPSPAVGRPLDDYTDSNINNNSSNNGKNDHTVVPYYDECATLLLEDDGDEDFNGVLAQDDADEELPPSPPQRRPPRIVPSDALPSVPTVPSSIAVTHVSDSAPGLAAASTTMTTTVADTSFFTDGGNYKENDDGNENDMAWFDDAGVDENEEEILRPSPKKPRYLR
ncbi:Cell cycle checkpoint control protein rad9b [Geranomyces michiganensis]|nr:Cell cycle checkpoint control protein rad9b [Geranomyces michiganensis]